MWKRIIFRGGGGGGREGEGGKYKSLSGLKQFLPKILATEKGVYVRKCYSESFAWTHRQEHYRKCISHNAVFHCYFLTSLFFWWLGFNIVSSGFHLRRIGFAYYWV